MEITLLEDPACPWCWAFQPVTTALEFEFPSWGKKAPLRIRRVLGGASDRPIVDGSFPARQWRRASEISGMPFDTSIWDRHLLRTTFEACRAVKAAQSQGSEGGARLLRRLREAFFVEGLPIDDRETIVGLAAQEGLDAEALRESLANGRADLLFQRDRHEAMSSWFGFPTILVRKHPAEPPSVLYGLVTYGEVLAILFRQGLSPRDRCRFTGTDSDWERLFALRPTIAPAELRLLTGLGDDRLEEAMRGEMRPLGSARREEGLLPPAPRPGAGAGAGAGPRRPRRPGPGGRRGGIGRAR